MDKFVEIDKLNKIVDFCVDNISKINCFKLSEESVQSISKSFYDIPDRLYILSKTYKNNVLNFPTYYYEHTKKKGSFDVTKLTSDYWIDKLIIKKLKYNFYNILECLERIERHKKRISTFLKYSPVNISSIQVLNSETHNKGKVPIIISFDNYKKIVYKSVNLKLTSLFNFLIDLIFEKNSWFFVKCVKNISFENNYGFMEFIDNNNVVDNIKDVEEFYKKLGIIIAIAYCFNITDIHKENLIVNNSFPVMIDLEAMLYRFSNELKTNDVRNTGMIGIRNSSSLQGRVESFITEPHEFFNEFNKNHINYQKKIDMRSHRIYFGNTLIEPTDYTENIIDGFQYAYKLIENKKRNIIINLEKYLMNNKVKIRQINRYTNYYNLMLLWVIQPSFDTYASLTSKLKERLMKDECAYKNVNFDILVNAEMSDLLNGDVPFFWTYPFSNSIYHKNSIVVKDYFKLNAFENVKKKLNRLSRKDINKQINLMNEVINEKI